MKLRGNGHARATPDGKAAQAGLSRTGVLTQEAFAQALQRERKRTERSRRPFVLVLVEAKRLLDERSGENVLGTVVHALSHSTRETDTVGWYKDGAALGIIFTEIAADGNAVAEVLVGKVLKALSSHLAPAQVGEIGISSHVFPEEWGAPGAGGSADAALYPEAGSAGGPKRVSRLVKRAMDIAGSLAALVVLSPLFAAIAVVVKLTSKGPVLYRAKRVGRFGREFTFLKFRSMYTGNDPTVHKEYVTGLITGKSGRQKCGESSGQVYKLTADPRVTPVGRFLRKTSLDELPQFFNVLMGQMSLVGPRPPIPYEVACYDVWHRERLLAVKPGITGLWQVHGRSRVAFDEMVRMDLRYARSWSLWMDVKLLLQTPRAVIAGAGAH